MYVACTFLPCLSLSPTNIIPPRHILHSPAQQNTPAIRGSGESLERFKLWEEGNRRAYYEQGKEPPPAAEAAPDVAGDALESAAAGIMAAALAGGFGMGAGAAAAAAETGRGFLGPGKPKR